MRAVIALLCMAALLFLLSEVADYFYTAGYNDACKSIGGVTLHTVDDKPICITEAYHAFSR